MYLGQFPTLPQWLLLAGLFQPSVINFLDGSFRSEAAKQPKIENTQTFNGQYDALLLTSPKLGFMEMS